MSVTDDLLRAAMAHHRSGDTARAEDCYRQVLAHDPADPRATHFLGMLQHQAGRHEDGLRLLRRSVELAAEVAEFHSNLAAVLGQLRRPEQGIPHLREALRLRPDYVEAHKNLGMAYEQSGRLEPALEAYAAAAGLAPTPNASPDPTAAALHNDVGRVLYRLGRLRDAEAAHRQALQFDANFVPALTDLAVLHEECGRIDDALECHHRVVRLRPDVPAAHSHMLFTLLHHAGLGPESLLNEHRLWAHRHARPLYPPPRRHGNPPDPDRPLRIGYVSHDFQEHTVPRFFEPVLCNHDRSRFTPVCYYNAGVVDAVTARLRAAAGEWRDVEGWSDERLADQVRADAIDILVDLTGHMLGGRMTLFARRPAPVQVTYLGYPHTTGLETMDYRVTDALCDPPGRADRYHTEQLVRLAGCAWCYRPDDADPRVNDPPAAAAGSVTFGSLNRLLKVGEPVIRLWSRVLASVPNSRLLLAAPPDAMPDIRRRFELAGTHAGRVDLVENRPRPDYMRLFHRIDVHLDPFPYNGMTTTCDGLWMGVPTVTLAGDTHVSRVGLDLLSQVGLGDFAAADADRYVDLAGALAANRARLAALRETLRETMRHSPLMDYCGCARRLEQAYRAMWSRWSASADA